MRAIAAAADPAVVPRWIFLAAGLAAVLLGALVAWDPAVTGVAFVTLCACLLSWWRPAALIGAIAFYIPIERLITAQLPDTAFMMSQASGEIVLLALLAGVLARRAARKEAFVSTPIDLALLTFVGVCVLSAFANGVSVQSTAYGIRIVLRYTIVFYAIVNGGFTQAQIRTFVMIFFAAVALQIAVGLLQALTGGAAKEWFIVAKEVSVGGVDFVRGLESGTGRGLFTVIFGTLEHYNNYGHFMSLALVFAFAISSHKGILMGQKRLRAILVLALVCIVLSFSRSSLLIAIVGTVVVLFARGNKKAASAIVFVLLAGLGAIIYMGITYSGQDMPVYSTSFVYRWVRPFTPDRLALTDAGNYRLFLLFIVSVRAVSQSPLLGLGPGTFGSALTRTGNPEIYEGLGMNYEYAGKFAADSNWTTIVAQTGVLGILAIGFVVIGMAAYSVRVLRRTPNPVLKGLCLGQLAVTTVIILAAFFSPAFENRFTAYYYWAMSGLTVALARSDGFASGSGRLRRLFSANGSAKGPSP
jgi:hypothetical protein